MLAQVRSRLIAACEAHVHVQASVEEAPVAEDDASSRCFNCLEPCGEPGGCGCSDEMDWLTFGQDG